MSWPRKRPTVLFDDKGQRYCVLSSSEARAELWGAFIDAIDRFNADQETETTSGQEVIQTSDPQGGTDLDM